MRLFVPVNGVLSTTTTLFEFGSYAPPLASYFTSVVGSPGTVTMTDVSGQGLSFLVTGATGNDQMGFATVPLSGLPTDWKIRARLVSKTRSGNSPSCGIWVHNTSNGQCYGLAAEQAGGSAIIHVRRNSNLTTFLSNDTTWNVSERPTWFEVEKVGTALFFRYSWDGIDFFTYTTTTTTYASSFDKIGIGGANRGDAGAVTDRGGFLCTYYDDPNHLAANRAVSFGLR